MDKWIKLASAIYYTGVGAVLLATTVRFFYRLIRNYDADSSFVAELKEVHLTNIYSALGQIATNLGIKLDYPPPGGKPLSKGSPQYMDTIRLATVEEVDPIQKGLDITPFTTVVTFGGKDFAVVRQCTELDPMIFAEDTTDRRKLFFLTNLETALRLQGTKEIYFNIPAGDAAYIDIVKRLGAEPISPEPMIRFKKVL